jgi:uroporphyrinogen decarboxylase
VNRFAAALAGREQFTPPIWFMRQAGRYQRAYQALRRRHSFEALCREPDLSARVALSSIEDFDFDAAILFSDLLFPLEALGFGLRYDDSGPHITGRLTRETLGRLRTVERAARALSFQAEAVTATRRELPADKGLIGFVGGPWTLFVYAMEGTHKGALGHAKTSMDLYRRFSRVMTPLLIRAARAQLDAGADVVMVFDTAAGELTPADFQKYLAPDLAKLAGALPNRLGYYARGLHPAHFATGDAVSAGVWAGHGFDWRWEMADVLTNPGRKGFVQGNFDPALLRLTGRPLGRAIETFLAPIVALPNRARRGWICGLGHGVLPGTPEESVRAFVKIVRRRLADGA